MIEQQYNAERERATIKPKPERVRLTPKCGHWVQSLSTSVPHRHTCWKYKDHVNPEHECACWFRWNDVNKETASVT